MQHSKHITGEQYTKYERIEDDYAKQIESIIVTGNIYNIKNSSYDTNFHNSLKTGK